MRQEEIPYQIDGASFLGYLVLPSDEQTNRPAIIVAPAWHGIDEFARQKAQILAALGYVAFVADLYGEGKEVATDEEAGSLMMPLFLNRSLLQKRMLAAYNTLCQLGGVDINKIGGIGFCFGGLAIIELLRSGIDVKGTVSFHATLGNRKGDQIAQTVPIAQDIKGSLLMLHGHDDPLVSIEAILNIQKELTDANVDWQMHIYGHTSHAFTNPDVNDPQKGLIYNPQSDKRSWQSMCSFFEEIFI